MKTSSKINWQSIFTIKLLLVRLVGVFFCVVALEGFLIPNNFLDGGVTAIVILLGEYTPLEVYQSLILLNAPFFILSYFKIGKEFAITSFISVLVVSLILFLIPDDFFTPFTTDKFLTASLGGVSIGMGVGLIIKSGGGVIEGLEILSIFGTKKTFFSSTEIILFINTIIFLFVFFILDGQTEALYSIITFYTSSKTSDYVINGFNEFIEVTIVSKKDSEVKKMIFEDFGKAITVFKGERGYVPNQTEQRINCDIIVILTTRLEFYHLQKQILSVDEQAFIYSQKVKETKGAFINQQQQLS